MISTRSTTSLHHLLAPLALDPEMMDLCFSCKRENLVMLEVINCLMKQRTTLRLVLISSTAKDKISSCTIPTMVNAVSPILQPLTVLKVSLQAPITISTKLTVVIQSPKLQTTIAWLLKSKNVTPWDSTSEMFQGIPPKSALKNARLIRHASISSTIPTMVSACRVIPITTTAMESSLHLGTTTSGESEPTLNTTKI